MDPATPLILNQTTVTRASDVQVGDLLGSMDSDEPNPVEATRTRVCLDVYTVHQSDGFSFTVSGDTHLFLSHEHAPVKVNPFTVTYFDKKLLRPHTVRFTNRNKAAQFLGIEKYFARFDFQMSMTARDVFALSPQKIAQLRMFRIPLYYPYNAADSISPTLFGLWLQSRDPSGWIHLDPKNLEGYGFLLDMAYYLDLNLLTKTGSYRLLRPNGDDFVLERLCATGIDPEQPHIPDCCIHTTVYDRKKLLCALATHRTSSTLRIPPLPHEIKSRILHIIDTMRWTAVELDDIVVTTSRMVEFALTRAVPAKLCEIGTPHPFLLSNGTIVLDTPPSPQSGVLSRLATRILVYILHFLGFLR